MTSVPKRNAVDVLDWTYRMGPDRGKTLPRINVEFLNSVIYLYASSSDANDGRSSGGSGFIVGVPSIAISGIAYAFAVTNRHVIDGGASVIRLNTKDGKTRTQETDERDWLCHPDGTDLAVLPLEIDQAIDDIHFISTKHFAHKDIIEALDIGPGDEVFVVGRFINHEGRQKNLPSARFGHIAQMANEPIVYRGQQQESFIVEARSIGGYSGSPVFIYIEPKGMLAGRRVDMSRPPPQNDGGFGPWMLGIDWCHLLDWSPVCDASGQPLNAKLAGPWDQQVKTNTGMMGVIPSWKLMEILELPQIKEIIGRAELEILKKEGPQAVEIDTSRPKLDQNPTHREDFNRLLGAAVKPPKSSDQT